MTALPNLRYERKFLAPRCSLAEVLATVRRHPAAFREVYPERFVNNIYFDSPALRDYFDHVNGATDRVKTCIRWYGALSGPIAAPTLERKVKRGVVSGKHAYPLPPLHVNGGIEPGPLQAAFENAGLPGSVRAGLLQLHPVLVNRYRRRYFLSADGRFRLTADDELQFLAARRTTGTTVSPRRGSPTVILELKFEAREADHAARVTNAFPFRLTRCSKYVLGVEQLLVRHLGV